MVFIRCQKAVLSGTTGIDGHNVLFTAVYVKSELTHLSRIGPQKIVGIRRNIPVSLFSPSFQIKTKPRLFTRFIRNDINDPADGIGPILGTGCTLNNFDMVYIFRSQSL